MALDTAVRVRRNTASAGIAAACLLYFGFFGSSIAPDVTNMFTLGDAVFNYTIRIGGVLMALVTVASLSGRLPVLLADAVVSVTIGLSLAFSGLCMIVGGGGMGFNYMLYLVFGGMFISAGVRNGREYLQWVSSPRAGTLRPKAYVSRAPEPAAEMDQPPPPPGSLAGRLLHQRSNPDEIPATPTPTAISLEHAPPQAAPHSDAQMAAEPFGPPEAADQPEDQSANPPDPYNSDNAGGDLAQDSPPAPGSEGGFLSAFADDDPPPTS